MNKIEYKDFIESAIEAAKAKTVEKGQDAMLDAFLEDELERILVSDLDDTFYKEETEQFFNYFQGAYKYEHQEHFSPIDLFE